jgi:type II secretory ATPase GspE/PulE/Tfp pilus assembly ATPase PilB-like protein
LKSLNGARGIDEQFCRTHRIFPVLLSAGIGHLLLEVRSDLSILSYVSFLAKSDFQLKRVATVTLEQAIADCFADEGEAGVVKGLATQSSTSAENAEDGIVVQQINALIRDCIAGLASDIHFEPRETGMVCRARVDGMLLQKRSFERELVPEVVSRLKIMSGLDIAEKRRPQDGRVRFPVDNRSVDIRVSVIPTEFGEKVVLRILDKETLHLNLESLGFSTAHLELFKRMISLPNGIILVTGPTGSGKTTTLYSALNHLRSPHVNISTVEDPIEYNLPGINQSQVKPEIGLTFSAMLRALLRQDPNIMMVGEIRDRETLDIAIRASLTGHLVLSTVHTNSAIATISRLRDMGAEPFLLASSLKLIVAQRLVRKICPVCVATPLDEANLAAAKRLGLSVSNRSIQKAGCDQCNFTGYTGRTAVYELLTVDDVLRPMVQQEHPEQDILEVAKGNGFATMLQGAQVLVRAGVTTPVEVLRELSSL